MIRKDSQPVAASDIIRPVTRSAVVVLLLLAGSLKASRDAAERNWTNYVRIGAYGLRSDNAERIVRSAQEDGVFGIEVDNDIEGRYESFVNPEEKLKAIRDVAKKAHAAGNRAFVYIAGTECITANAAHTPHTLFKEHPEWLKIYMERVRQIAGTGIDGIYVDIPYWMTHFDGWEDTWASFDDYTVAAFKKESGLDAKKDLKLGDFSDGNFRKWVDFRIRTFTDLMQEIDRNAKSE